MDPARLGISPPFPADSEFIKQLSIEHGPVQLLGRFFLRAVTALAKLELTPVWLTPEELQSANRANRDSWIPMLPTFDIEFSRLDATNFRAIGIRDASGRIVGSHALRYFDWTGTTYGEELASYRLLYASPATSRLKDERCVLTAGEGARITGKVAFSGAAWFHPSVRKLGLSYIVPRIGKAVALSTWPIERIVALMTESVFKAGFAPRFGYHGIDWGVVLDNSRLGTINAALIWIDRVNLEHFLEIFTARSEVDGRVLASDADEAMARAAEQGK
jgi:hypothetical protein